MIDRTFYKAREGPQSNQIEGCHEFDKRFAESVAKNQIPPQTKFPFQVQGQKENMEKVILFQRK